MILIRIKRLVGSGIYPLADQLLTQVSVPVVLYFIVSTSRNSPSYQRPPETKYMHIWENPNPKYIQK